MQQGDWLVGHTTKADGNRLLYAMQVSEVLDFDDYFHDPRFQTKKPRRGGSWQQRCGDNIYFRELGGWAQAFTYHHREKWRLAKDTNHPSVYISDYFFYFGENAQVIPDEFHEIIQRRHGVRCSIPPNVAEAFVGWLEKSFEPGRHGDPRDRNMRPGETRSSAPQVRRKQIPIR
jgi:hypothetical protein